MITKNYNPIRELAKTTRWQTLYARAKDLNISLFDNSKDLSRLQIIFLSYLELYYNLYKNLSQGDELLDKEVIESDILVDAYLTYKNKEKEFKKKPKKQKENNTDIPNIVFTRK